MKKVTTIVLMLCLTLSGAWCHASGVDRTENEKGEGIPHELHVEYGRALIADQPTPSD